MVTFGEERISGRHLLARQVWEGITTGFITMADGRKLALSPQDWKDFVKWVYSHIDGPPRQELDITSDDKAIKGYVVVSPDDWDNRGNSSDV
jgi:hypothetical protein